LAVDIWQSAGYWYVNNNGVEYQFNSEQEARRAMEAMEASEQPIEAELAKKITGELLPQLRKLFAEMSAMQLAWHDNDVSALIERCARNNQTLVGFSPETWALWGATFQALQRWLETENESLGGVRPRTILMKRYVSES
jgi:hypothetical protein